MSRRREENNAVIKPGNLSTDDSLIDQPQGATTFSLNAVNETDDGDRTLRSNENSNEKCYTLPAGTSPLGKLYIGNNETLLFLVSDIGDSYIAIVDSENNLNVIVTDRDQTEKFGFKINKQIDATFRLRRGCERTIYFVTPKPRIFVIEKLEKYKNTNGTWNINDFNLFKTYSKIPSFSNITVEESGVLPPGSYNASIQYLDEDLNPTEFIASSKVVKIYNSNIRSTYRNVRGSTATINAYQNFGNTNKAIKFKFANLDTNYPFYRIAITEANTGNGEISATKYSSEISTLNNNFTYTGSNFESIGTQTEILAFNNIIDEATSIEQLENKLILTDIKGKNIDFCKLQKYASKITVDAIPKSIVLNSMVANNAKSSTLDMESIGYMPEEIYSFGAVYIFDDNTISPVYHIPGKSHSLNDTSVFTAGGIPMSIIKNTNQDNTYTDNNSCGTDSLWGKDSEGNNLLNTPVRHHRFPSRASANLPFVEKVDASNLTIAQVFKRLKVHITGNLHTPVLCPILGEPGYSASCVNEVVLPFQFRVTYSIDGVPNYYTHTIDPADWGGVTSTPIVLNLFTDKTLATNIIITKIEEENVLLTSTITEAGTLLVTGVSAKQLTYTVGIDDELQETQEDIYKASIFGARFSNIELPSLSDTNGHKIIGYYIVRNERTEDEKTVLDSGVLTSTITNKNFVSHGLLMPELTPAVANTIVRKDIYSLINPEFKFNNTKYINFDIKQKGKFVQVDNIHSRVKVNDVLDGSSYDSTKHKSGRSDSDGWQLQIKTRDNITVFQPTTQLVINNEQIKDVFYLSALADKEITDSLGVGVDVFNLSSDNKIGIISLTEEIPTPIVNSIPYVYLIKDSANPYSNFRLTPYYKENMNPIYFNSIGEKSTCDIFSGDSHITPIRYTNSIFYDNRVRLHAGKTSVWNYIAAGVLIVAAVLIEVFSVGVATFGAIAIAGLATSLVGGATALIASGIKQDAWDKAYNKLYKEGLKETIEDDYLRHDGPATTGCNNGATMHNDACIGFSKNPSDDEIQWLGDSINLWFESKVNMALRHGATDGTPDFLNAPGNKQLGTGFKDWDDEYFGTHSVGSKSIPPTTLLDFHMLNKLTYLDANRKKGKAYLGIALAELYQINPDYKRTDKQKIFNHLPLEYDCCSDCTETFPHRIAYSEQAFQEELTDNFRKFLPNNYRDIEGETGRITDMFRIQNKLYLHTEEALWELPQNFQERVTNEIVSFLGTGEYFNVPPRKVVDDSNSSAGNTHKWGRIKIRYGVLFPSHKEKKWYLFNGEKLEPITDAGMSSYFKENMNFLIEDKYYADNRKPYLYSNNPSNPLGVGYISTYDTKKERLIITKKDFQITNLPTSNYHLTNDGGQIVLFNSLTTMISTEVTAGWTYLGFENGKLKFSKKEIVTELITRDVTTWVPPVYNDVSSPSNCEYVSSLHCTIQHSNAYGDDEPYNISFTLCDGSPVSVTNYVAYQSTSTEEFSNICIQKNSIQTTGLVIMDKVLVANTSCDVTITSTLVTAGYWQTTSVTSNINILKEVYKYVAGTPFVPIYLNNSFTMSYSLKDNQWVSWHSYLPSFYFHVQEKFYAWKQGGGFIYRFNKKNSYQTFFDVYYPFIIEYVDNNSPLNSQVTENITLHTEARQWDSAAEEYLDNRYITFNKLLVYNTHQISGILNLIVKQEGLNYINEQISNSLSNITIDRNERNWSLNQLRDMSTSTSVAMFKKKLTDIQSNYFIDKIVNSNRINMNKSWMEMESFRDKFLVVRLIFDTFDNTRLIMNFSIQDSKQSER